MNSFPDFLVASLFSGGGGSSLGYHRAGATVLFAVERDAKKAAIYQRNFPSTVVLSRRIEQLDPLDCLRRVGLQPRELTLLDGSPPCQGFSVAGKQDPNDRRNFLYLEFARFLEAIQPQLFVVENVDGMLLQKMRPFLREMLRVFQLAGYRVTPVLLNAKNYSVPQSRKRIFLLGARNDLNLTLKPPPPHRQVITVGQAIANAPPDQFFDLAPEIKSIIEKLPEGGNLRRYSGRALFSYSIYRLYWSAPARTITTAFNHKMPTHVHPLEDRFLTVSELKRLSSFPDDFDLGDDPYLAADILGNSVPPNLIRAIAESLWGQLKEVTHDKK